MANHRRRCRQSAKIMETQFPYYTCISSSDWLASTLTEFSLELGSTTLARILLRILFAGFGGMGRDSRAADALVQMNFIRADAKYKL